MAIDFDTDDFDLKELNFDEPESLDCRLGILQFDDDLELEFDDDEDEFPIQNWDDGDEKDFLLPKKRIRTIFPCKK